MLLTRLETAVLQKQVQGEHPLLEELRRQIPDLLVEKREVTGAGFYTDFEAPKGGALPSRGQERLVFGNVIAMIPGLEHDAGFLLYVEGAHLTMLEGFSYAEPWPDDVTGFSLDYAGATWEELCARLDAYLARLQNGH